MELGAIGIFFVVLLVLFVLVVGWLIAMYNGLVRSRNQVKNAWSQIDVQLKRRHDLIPNLVETAKGYMTHERNTLEEITKARNLAVQPHTVGEQADAENQLTRAMSNFFVVVENYPDLKANENFLSLQEELASTENKIGFARQYYNDETMRYNTKVEQFPNNIVAGVFNFEESEFFEVEIAEERATPKVSFS